MLAPSINDTKTKLTNGYQSIVSLDNFSTTSSSISIVKLPKDPDWLPPVRTEVATLDAAAGDWRNARPDIWSPVLVSFVDYTATFGAFADTVKKGGFGTPAQWIDALQTTLLAQLTLCLNTTRQVETRLQGYRGEFSAVLPQIDKSIQAGWDEVASEEQAMLRLATELGGLEELVQSLSAKIDNDGISGDKSYLQSAVSLLYSAGTGASIPVLGIIAAVFSIGKTFYDLIKDNQDVVDAMNRINAVTAELSEDALGVALTKSTLQTLYRLEKDFVASQDAIPGLIDLWTGEQAKVQDAIHALQAGAKPDQYLDLLTVQVARANWRAIGDFVSDLINVDVTVGEPVTLDIAKAQITTATSLEPA